MQYAPTRVRPKPVRFHISAHVPAENAPDFIIPNKDTPKTRPVLHPNRRRGTFRGVCFCAPTRVRAKPVRFHIPAPGYPKNAPDFTLPNKDTPKTCPILDPNLWRGTFGGVCFCAPTRIRPKPARFYAQTVVKRFFGAYAIRPYTGTCKIWRVSYSRTRHSAKPDGFWTLPLDIARNPAGFGLCHTTWHETRRVLDFATRHSAKPGGFWTLSHDMARNPAGF